MLHFATVGAGRAGSYVYRKSVYNTDMMPRRKTEMSITKHEHEYVAGLDEVGRGAWAGPLVAAAVILPRGERIIGVRDSKLLSEEKREEVARAITSQAIAWSYGVVSHKEIDAYGLTEANRLVFERALQGLREPAVRTLVDGAYRFTLPYRCNFIKGGDRTEYCIAAASNVAKVFRDRLMRSAHRLYPAYGFDRHKGYGTREHQKALRRYGNTPFHRKSFLTNVLK